MHELTEEEKKHLGISGGRHLDAISLNDKLTIYEKAVLHEIANKMNMGGVFDQTKWAYASDLCRRTSMGRSKLFATLRGLEERGYIRRRKRMAEDGSRNIATDFSFTPKLFQEFQEFGNVKLLRKSDTYAMG